MTGIQWYPMQVSIILLRYYIPDALATKVALNSERSLAHGFTPSSHVRADKLLRPDERVLKIRTSMLLLCLLLQAVLGSVCSWNIACEGPLVAPYYYTMDMVKLLFYRYDAQMQRDGSLNYKRVQGRTGKVQETEQGMSLPHPRL